MARRASNPEVVIATLQTDIRYIREKVEELSRKFDDSTKEVVELKVRLDELEKRFGGFQKQVLEEQKRELGKWTAVTTALATFLASLISAAVGHFT